MGRAEASGVEVSVVLPTRNGAGRIAGQLAALAASRTSRSWELIISDNGSTDGTPEVVAAWADAFPALTIVDSSGRGGVAHARNVGVEASSGSLILHCDDDDEVGPHWLERMADALGSADLVGGRLDLLAKNDPSWFGCTPGDGSLAPFQTGEVWAVMGANLGYRRAVFEATGGFDPSFGPGNGEDVEFCWRAQAHGFRFATVSAAVVAYAQRGSMLALARQHFAYGRGMRQLERRFAGAVSLARSSALGRSRNALSLLLRSYRRACLRELARRSAWYAGSLAASLWDPPPPPAPGLLGGVPDPGLAGRPLVTAGVTAYNAAETIERAVRSAAEQTWRPLEILAVDDGSHDETPAILRRLEREIPELRVVEHERNRGAGAGRNTVLEHARGEFVAFFDDDDVSDPRRIEWQVELLLQHEQRYGPNHPVMVHTARTVVSSEGRRWHVRVSGADPLKPGPGGRALVDHLMRGVSVRSEPAGAGPTCTQLGRLASYAEVGGFDPALRRAEDAEFNVRLAAAGGHLIGVAEPLVEQHLTGGAEKRPAAEGRAELAILDKHRGYLPDAASYLAGRQWVFGRVALREGSRAAAARHLWCAWILQPGPTSRRMVAAVLRRLPRN